MPRGHKGTGAAERKARPRDPLGSDLATDSDKAGATGRLAKEHGTPKARGRA